MNDARAALLYAACVTQPEKIILCGSFVSGLVHEGSDLDLVIIKETPKRPNDDVEQAACLCV